MKIRLIHSNSKTEQNICIDRVFGHPVVCYICCLHTQHYTVFDMRALSLRCYCYIKDIQHYITLEWNMPVFF